MNAERMHLYGLPLLAVRVGVTMVVATASFYLVEQPIRRGSMATLGRVARLAGHLRRLPRRGGRHRGGHPAVGGRGSRAPTGRA